MEDTNETRQQLKDRIIRRLIDEGDCLAEFETTDINVLIVWIEELIAFNDKPQDDIDTCLRDGCDTRAQANYRLCPKHLREAHNEGFDDSNK